MMAIEALEMLKKQTTVTNSDAEPTCEEESNENIDETELVLSYVNRNDWNVLIPTLDGQNRSAKAFLHHLPLNLSKAVSSLTACLISGSLTIGSHSSMDVCLRGLSPCAAISSKHAVIYHDKQCNTFELLNYSEFGTMVDGCVYCFNIDEDVDFWGCCNSHATDVYPDRHLCRCRAGISSISRKYRFIEGPALLKHGSLIVIGCVRFLFVVVDDRALIKPTITRTAAEAFDVNSTGLVKRLKTQNSKKLSNNESLSHRSIVTRLIGDSNKSTLL